MNSDTVGTDIPFEERLSPSDRMGEVCPVATCSGRLDLVFG